MNFIRSDPDPSVFRRLDPDPVFLDSQIRIQSFLDGWIRVNSIRIRNHGLLSTAKKVVATCFRSQDLSNILLAFEREERIKTKFRCPNWRGGGGVGGPT